MDARFIGWQERTGGLKPFPMFNVEKKGHRLYESTVSEITLEREGLMIPKFPTFEEWRKQNDTNQNS